MVMACDPIKVKVGHGNLLAFNLVVEYQVRVQSTKAVASPFLDIACRFVFVLACFTF